jgi:hypothetical protein
MGARAPREYWQCYWVLVMRKAGTEAPNLLLVSRRPLFEGLDSQGTLHGKPAKGHKANSPKRPMYIAVR